MKEKIAETALQQFLKYGIRDITIARLIEPLRISTKTFYKYYESKEVLLKECLDIHYGNSFRQLRGVVENEKDPVTKLLAVFRQALAADFGINHAFYHDLNYYYPELQNEAIAKIRDRSGSLMLPLMKAGIRDGYFLEDLDLRIALTGVNTLYTSITRGREYEDQGYAPALLFENLVVVFIRGMCTAKGRRQLDQHSKLK
jgi:AcrR family transcriptional regulator